MVRRNNLPIPNNPPEPVNPNSPQYIQQQFNKLCESRDRHEGYQIMKTLPKKIDEINPRVLVNPSKFIEECLYPFGLHILQTYEDDTHIEVAEQTIISIIEKIIGICSMYPKPIRNLEFVVKLLRVKCHLFSHEPMKNKLFRKQQTDSFYLICISATFQQLKKYSTRFLKQLSFAEILDLVEIINQIDTNTLNSRQADDLIEAIYHQLASAFSEQKFEQKDFQIIRALETKLLKKVVRFPIRNAISRLGVTIAKGMLGHYNTGIVMQGLNLIESYMADFQKRNSTVISEPEFANFIKDQQIYKQILDLPVFRDAFQINRLIFREFQKYNPNEETRLTLLKESFEHRWEQRTFYMFLIDQLSKPWKDSSRQKLYMQLSNKIDFSLPPVEYFEVLKKLSSEKITSQLFLKSVRIYAHRYQKFNSQYQKAITDLLNFCLNNQRQYFQKDRGDQAVQLFQKIITSIFQTLNQVTLFLIDKVVSDEQLWHQVPNKQYCRILTSALQKQNSFQKIIEIIKKNEKHKNTIYFMIKRLIINGEEEISVKFIELFVKGLKQIAYLYPLQERCFNEILMLFRSKPCIDFQLFELCFENVNQKYLLKQAQSNVLLYIQTQKLLLRPLKDFKFYEQTLKLIEQTDSQQLRSHLCEFIMKLYNYKVKIFGAAENGQEAFSQFLDENMKQLISHVQNNQNNLEANSLLAKLYLLQKGLEYTDISGTTQYYPHENYPNEESKVKLNMENHITIGDDVPQQATLQFSENSTLYEVLTAFGKQFKCGPQEILPSSINRIFSPVNNLRSIADLSIPNNAILIGEKSYANPLKIPTLQEIDQCAGLKQNFVQVVTGVFKHFAVNNKMGPDQCLMYAIKATGIVYTLSDKKVKAILNFDSDNDGLLTLQDFIRYFRHKVQLTMFNSAQLEDQLFRFRIRKNFTTYDSIPREQPKEFRSLRDEIMKNPNPIYKSLFNLSKHSDERITNKSRQLLLYLPSLPKDIDKRYLDFSQDNDFEIYYKLIDVVRQFNRFAEDKQRCKELMEIVTPQFISNLMGKYRFSDNFYNKKSYKCLQSISNIILKLKKYSQQGGYKPLNPFLSTSSQRININLFSNPGLPFSNPFSKDKAFSNPQHQLQCEILVQNAKKTSKKQKAVKRICEEPKPVLFQDEKKSQIDINNIFKSPRKLAEPSKGQLQFHNLTLSLPNNSLGSVFGEILAKEEAQKNQVNKLPNERKDHQKMPVSSRDLQSQNASLKKNLSQINNCISQLQGEITHEAIPESVKDKIHLLLLKMRNLAIQPQRKEEM